MSSNSLIRQIATTVFPRARLSLHNRGACPTGLEVAEQILEDPFDGNRLFVGERLERRQLEQIRVFDGGAVLGEQPAIEKFPEDLIELGLVARSVEVLGRR